MKMRATLQGIHSLCRNSGCLHVSFCKWRFTHTLARTHMNMNALHPRLWFTVKDEKINPNFFLSEGGFKI